MPYYKGMHIHVSVETMVIDYTTYSNHIGNFADCAKIVCLLSHCHGCDWLVVRIKTPAKDPSLE